MREHALDASRDFPSLLSLLLIVLAKEKEVRAGRVWPLAPELPLLPPSHRRAVN